jgi:hypothetical protein
MARYVPPALQAHLNGEVITVAKALTITRRDGREYRYTSHDRDVVINGMRFVSGVAFETSAIKSSSDLSVDNFEVMIEIGPLTFTKAELLSDLLEDAKYELHVFNWQSISDGISLLKSGTVGEIEVINDLYAKLQLRGLAQGLQDSFLESYSPTCRANFGDNRCAFATLPTRFRVPGRRYITSDFFVTPVQNFSAIPLANASFEASPGLGNTNNILGWTIPDGSFFSTTGGVTPFDGSTCLFGGTENVTPSTGAKFFAYQEFSPSALGYSSIDVNNGLMAVTINAMVCAATTEVRNNAYVFLQAIDADDVILLATKSPFQRLKQDSWEAISATLFVPPNTRLIRLGLEAQKNNGSTAAIAFDNVTASHFRNEAATFSPCMQKVVRIPGYGLSERLVIRNSSFALDGQRSNTDTPLSNWTLGAGTFYTITASWNGLTPQTTNAFLTGGDNTTGGTYEFSQVVPLKSSALVVDAGASYLNFEIRAAKSDASTLTVLLDFLNDSDVSVGTITEPITFAALSTWTVFEKRYQTPVGARKVKIILQMVANGTAANVAVDTISIYDINTVSESEDDALFGLVDSLEPAYSATVDGITDDGDLIVQTRPTIFEFGAVTAAVDGRTVEVTAPVSAANILPGGKLTWLSGPNAGRVYTIRKLDVPTSRLSFFEPLASTPVPGNRFILHRGCDKTIATCSALRNNFNFRGEPYLPGPEKVLEFFTPTNGGTI